MGNSNGSIPIRDDVDHESRDVNDKWRYCAITQEPLGLYIVTCGLGRLYNRIAAIDGIVNRALLPPSAQHIQDAMDIRDVTITINPKKQTAEGMNDDSIAPFICPITQLEMRDDRRFVYNWRCGCLVSEIAFLQAQFRRCIRCLRLFDNFDIIVLYGNEQDLEVMRGRLAPRHAKADASRIAQKQLPVSHMLNILLNPQRQPDLYHLINSLKKPMVIYDEVVGRNNRLIKRRYVVPPAQKLSVFISMLILMALFTHLPFQRRTN